MYISQFTINCVPMLRERLLAKVRGTSLGAMPTPPPSRVQTKDPHQSVFYMRNLKKRPQPRPLLFKLSLPLEG